jgi:NAD(P)-dependent dehydrogenase (short-subunit alcohol dehydrogenase family)
MPKIAIVTGASRGLSAAPKIARKGNDLVVTYRSRGGSNRGARSQGRGTSARYASFGSLVERISTGLREGCPISMRDKSGPRAPIFSAARARQFMARTSANRFGTQTFS